MKRRLLEDEEPTVLVLALVLSMVLSAMLAIITLGSLALAAPAAADPTLRVRAGTANSGQTARIDDRREHRKEHSRHFSDHDRVVVRGYYQADSRTGKCAIAPAKKNDDGCPPAGQAKKWQIGHQLPTGLVFSEVPLPIITELPRPSPGLRYVRIGTDILPISTRTEVVVAALFSQEVMPGRGSTRA